MHVVLVGRLLEDVGTGNEKVYVGLEPVPTAYECLVIALGNRHYRADVESACESLHLVGESGIAGAALQPPGAGGVPAVSRQATFGVTHRVDLQSSPGKVAHHPQADLGVAHDGKHSSMTGCPVRGTVPGWEYLFHRRVNPSRESPGRCA